MTGTECWGLHWVSGHAWGDAHPEANIYSDPGELIIDSGMIRLGIGMKPRKFYGRIYPWCAGVARSLECFMYGTFDLRFRLPIGNNLWPAIWMYDKQCWPPEIDMLEGWPRLAHWPIPHHTYRKKLFLNNIIPSIHFDSDDKTLRGGLRGHGTWPWFIDVHGINTLRLRWTPDMVEISYNGHRVMRTRDTAALRALNNSCGMHIILNNAVTSMFNHDDYLSLEQRNFIIYDLRYEAL